MSTLEETVTVSARLTATTEAVPEEAVPTEVVETKLSPFFFIAGIVIAYYFLGKIVRTG